MDVQVMPGRDLKNLLLRAGRDETAESEVWVGKVDEGTCLGHFHGIVV